MHGSRPVNVEYQKINEKSNVAIRYKKFLEHDFDHIMKSFFATDVEKTDGLKRDLFIAFHHPSWSKTEREMNEFKNYMKTEESDYNRLEFLGDGLIKAAIVMKLYGRRDRDMNPLRPSVMSSAVGYLVSNKTLCQIMMVMGLDDLIIHRVKKLAYKGNMVLLDTNFRCC